MTDRKTLQLRDPSEQSDTAPTLKKKGRGWEISEKRLDVLHEQARELRRHSSEAHKALAKRFGEADSGGFVNGVLDAVRRRVRREPGSDEER